MPNNDLFTPRNPVETALCMILLDAVRRLDSLGVNTAKVRYGVRVSPRGGDETAWVTIPVGNLPVKKID